MAGNCRPPGVNLGSEISLKYIGQSVRSGTGVSGLFNGATSNNWNTSDVCYWDASYNNYYEFELTLPCNIWRSGTTGWKSFCALFSILKYNGDSYDDITSTVEQTTSEITENQWEKTISNLQPGRYKFIATGFRIDSEWFVERANMPIKANLADMHTGDCIPCRYTAKTSGVAGYFSELGTCVADGIPVTGTPTPDGLFYFVKTAKGTLVADRVIQTNISWDVLNSAKFIDGYVLPPDVFKVDNSNITAFGNGGSLVFGTTSPQKLFNGIVTNDSNNEGYHVRSGLTRLYVGGMTPQPFKLHKIRYYPYSSLDYQPVDFTIEGSNDTTTGLDGIWETVKSFTGLADAPAGAWAEIIINSLKSYRAYRYNITSTGSSRIYFLLNELEFYALNDTEPPKLVRSLSGGCAYADANGNKSPSDCSKGAWPVINEWDKYICNSDLKGTITPGDDNVWHWKNIYSWCKETPISSFNPNTCRTLRGKQLLTNFTFSLSNYLYGFRPVLEYIEPDGSSKQTNLWY